MQKKLVFLLLLSLSTTTAGKSQYSFIKTKKPGEVTLQLHSKKKGALGHAKYSQGSNRMVLKTLYIKPIYRKKGHATRIINKLKKIAKNDGYKNIYFVTEPIEIDKVLSTKERKEQLPKLIEFYKKAGAVINDIDPDDGSVAMHFPIATQ